MAKWKTYKRKPSKIEGNKDVKATQLAKSRAVDARGAPAAAAVDAGEKEQAELRERLLRAAKKLQPEKVIPCPADVSPAVANVDRGVIAVFGPPGSPERKEKVAAIRDALPELPVKKLLALPDLGRALTLPAGAAPPDNEVEDLRDRFWTLLVRRYADLRVIGYYIFRDELDQHAPKLTSGAAEAAPGGPGEEALQVWVEEGGGAGQAPAASSTAKSPAVEGVLAASGTAESGGSEGVLAASSTAKSPALEGVFAASSTAESGGSEAHAGNGVAED